MVCETWVVYGGKTRRPTGVMDVPEAISYTSAEPSSATPGSSAGFQCRGDDGMATQKMLADWMLWDGTLR